MRVSQFLLSTMKETPSDAVVVSHRLMLRAGLIRQVAAGLYSWLPLGLRVLKKVENIVRQEMDRSGAQEVLLPFVQPAELWMESERWEKYGPELLRMHDRHQREFCLGPTHEEIITDMVRREIRSYKQLPMNFYQIHTKFRDEVRPRFGVMRAREFVMKDAYSFHADETSLKQTYQVMYETYQRIFTRIGLAFRAVLADTGNIGGEYSHEFHVLADSGEDAIAFSDGSDYAANVELAPAPPPPGPRPAATAALTKVDTPNMKTIEQVSGFFKVPASQCLKTLLVEGSDTEAVALVLRGDHELNITKAAKLPQVKKDFAMLSAAQVFKVTGAEPGSVGPLGLDIPVIADHAALQLVDFICGANDNGKHYQGTNWERDLPLPEGADIRNVVAGDASPDGHGKLNIVRGIEVGHIFQLGTQYSEAMGATCLDENGQTITMPMGCYGIGVSRIVAAAIEQNHDDHGIIWPDNIAPFQVALAPINMAKSQRLREAALQLYDQLQEAGFDVLFDDRPIRPGAMFADLDLIGIPHRVVVAEKGLDGGFAEYKHRSAKESENIPLDKLVEHLGKVCG